MHPYKRSVRISDLIKEEAAKIITQRLDNPKLGFVTVTGAKVSDDLRHATIFISVLDESRRGTTLQVLDASKPFIKSELARKVRIRYMPKIHFQIDAGVEYGKKIDKIMREIDIKDSADGEDEDTG
jgi:ribosome-binding factor A